MLLYPKSCMAIPAINKAPATPADHDRNLFAAIGYASFLSVFMMLAQPGDDFIHFHAKQGVILFIGSLLWFIPVIGWMIGGLSYVGMVWGFVCALQGKREQIPIVFKLAQKLQ